MSRKRPPEEINYDSAIVALRLPVPERDIIITSRHVADAGLQERVRNATPRQPVTFNVEELEDLHRGLAFDAGQTLDSKQRKTINKVLRKIEEFFEQDLDESELWEEGWDDEASVPRSPQEIFANIFGGPSSDSPDMPPDCRVVLTAGQRETLRAMDTVSLDVHKMLAVQSQDVLEFDFSPRQIMVISLAIKEAIELCRDEKSAQPYQEIAQQVSEALFATIEEAAARDAELRYRQSQGSQAKLAFQLKITLEGSKPPIWRRVLVGDCTLDVLHQIVQTAMGWTNSHLHRFEYGEDRFSDPTFELDEADYDETQVYLSQLVADGCQKLRYWYDFGDGWWHTIKIEKPLSPKPSDEFPKCIKGAGACPPEDIGGIWGYYEFLAAIRDPKHERHDEFVEWAGEDFDPNAFNIEETNKALMSGPADVLDS
jgi:hypothetical protein